MAHPGNKPIKPGIMTQHLPGGIIHLSICEWDDILGHTEIGHINYCRRSGYFPNVTNWEIVGFSVSGAERAQRIIGARLIRELAVRAKKDGIKNLVVKHDCPLKESFFSNWAHHGKMKRVGNYERIPVKSINLTGSLTGTPSRKPFREMVRGAVRRFLK